MDKPITLTLKNLIIAAALAVLTWLLIQIHGVLLLIFIALLLALVLEPAVEGLHKMKVPRSLAVFLTLFTIIGVVGALLTFSVTPAINQTILFIDQFPKLLGGLVGSVPIDKAVSSFSDTLVSQVASTSNSLIKITVDVFNAVLTFITVIFFSAYILIDMENLRALFIGVFRRTSQQQMVKETMDEIQQKLGGWVRGQLLLMIIVGAAVFVGLSLLRVEYVLPLAVISGLTEIIPIIGPMIAVIPAAIVGFAISPIVGVGVVGLFVLIHQLEGNLIVPKVMEKSVGFNPLVTMVVILTGGKLLGITGVLIAVPVTLVAKIVIQNILVSTHSA